MRSTSSRERRATRDKYRNNYTHSVPRERRNQDQDRTTALVQWDTPEFFVRPISTLTYYNLNTYIFNTSLAPYKGYQDYVDRWDVNGGADVGYNIAQGLAFTVGYRDGYQHQDQFSPGINSDQHFASNHYQRVLFGLEGRITDWLNVKLSGGPDFRDYNPDAPITHDRTTRFYGEAQATATITKTQSLNFAFKQWLFVSSTGLVPYDDISYALTYHWSATKKLGFDLGAKYLEANYTLGDDDAGVGPEPARRQGLPGLGRRELPDPSPPDRQRHLHLRQGLQRTGHPPRLARTGLPELRARGRRSGRAVQVLNEDLAAPGLRRGAPAPIGEPPGARGDRAEIGLKAGPIAAMARASTR